MAFHHEPHDADTKTFTADQNGIEQLLRARWGSCTIAANSKTFDADSLPALVAGDNEGLATYSADTLVAKLQRQLIVRLERATTNDKSGRTTIPPAARLSDHSREAGRCRATAEHLDPRDRRPRHSRSRRDHPHT